MKPIYKDIFSLKQTVELMPIVCPNNRPRMPVVFSACSLAEFEIIAVIDSFYFFMRNGSMFSVPASNIIVYQVTIGKTLGDGPKPITVKRVRKLLAEVVDLLLCFDGADSDLEQMIEVTRTLRKQIKALKPRLTCGVRDT